jgi:hypothetical protein
MTAAFLALFLGTSLPLLVLVLVWRILRRAWNNTSVREAAQAAYFNAYIEQRKLAAARAGYPEALGVTIAFEALLQRPAFRRNGRPCPKFNAELAAWLVERGWVPDGPTGYHFDPQAAAGALGHQPTSPQPTEDALGLAVCEALEDRADPLRRWRAGAAAPQPLAA